MARTRAAVFSLVLVGLVLSPALQNWRPEPRDGFPLSHYAMFTRSRGDTLRVTYLAALDQDGRRHRLHYSFMGTGGFNQSRKQINRLVREGRADWLCRQMAEQIEQLQVEPFLGLTEVQVISGWYHLDTWFEGEHSALSEEIHSKCPIPRQDQPRPDG